MGAHRTARTRPQERLAELSGALVPSTLVRVEPQALIRARALDWVANLPGWFPFLRPDAPDVLAFAEEVAVGLGPNDGEIPARLIDEGVALLAEDGHRSLVERFAAAHPDQWRAVCADSGDAPALERTLGTAAVRAAIFERRLPPPERLADLESGRAPAHSSREVLAVTLFAETVWSIVDAQEAEGAAVPGGSVSAFHAALGVAAVRRSVAEVRRVQALCAFQRPQLPVPGYPRASQRLEQAYARVAADDAFAAGVADALLPIYVACRAAGYSTSRN